MNLTDEQRKIVDKQVARAEAYIKAAITSPCTSAISAIRKIISEYIAKNGGSVARTMSAAEVRSLGFDIPENIPDCATSMVTLSLEPGEDLTIIATMNPDKWEWVGITCEIPNPV